MTGFEIELRGRIIAQGYLLEVALGSLVSGSPDPSALIEKLRFDLHTQLRSDYSALEPGATSQDATAAVVSSATGFLDEHLDRVCSQFERPAPPRHSA